MPSLIHLLIATLAICLVDSTVLPASKPGRTYGDRSTVATPDELWQLTAWIASNHESLTAELIGGLKAGAHFVSELCTNQTNYVLGSIGQRWTLQMLDSIGKPGSGFFYGNVQWLGNFDECMSSRSDWNSSLPAYQLVVGKYCTASVPINVTSAGVVLSLAVGLCVPGGCSANDTESLLQMVFQLAHLRRLQVSTVCQDQVQALDAPAIAAMCICAAFVLLLLLATAYDLAIRAAASRDLTRLSLVGEDDTACPSAALRHSIQAATLAEGEHTPLLRASIPRVGCDSMELAPAASCLRTPAGGAFGKILLCFSVYSNVTVLLRTAQHSGSTTYFKLPSNTHRPDRRLDFLDGIRFLTLCWVIVGHVYSYSMNSADSVYYVLTERLARWPSQGILNATFSTDTFFFLSGFLVSYILLNEMSSREGGLGPSQWLHIYIHRYLRLTPAYAAVLMIWSCLATFFSDGPFWPRTRPFNSVCADNWWTNLVYVNNFWSMDEQCMNWSWYLANDMQFLLIAPPLVWLTYRWRRIGISVLSALVVASCIASVVVTVNKHIFIDVIGIPLQGISSQGPTSTANLDFFAAYYSKPWCRFQAYGAGMLLAVLLRWHAQRDSAHLPSCHYLGWLVAIACWVAVIYAPHDVELGSRSIGVAEAAIYNGFGRLAWCFAVGWLVWSCYIGRAGWIARLLGWTPFGPLSRLTYCTYLVHPIVIMMTAAASRTLVSMADFSVASSFVGSLGLSTAVAFICSITFEMPIASLDRLLLSK